MVDQEPAAEGGDIAALVQQTDRLASNVQQLTARLAASEEIQATLEDAVTAIGRQARRNTSQGRFNKWVTGVAIALVALACVLGYLIYLVNANANGISDSNADVRELQTRTSDRVLCPLYGLFLDLSESAPPGAADENGDGVVTEAEQRKQDKAIRVIRDGYQLLGCKPPRPAPRVRPGE